MRGLSAYFAALKGHDFGFAAMYLAALKGHDFSRAAKGSIRMRALQAAEKPNRAVGRGFIPGIKPMESTRALAPEVCFSGISPENQPSSAASLAPEGCFSEISNSYIPFSATFALEGVPSR